MGDGASVCLLHALDVSGAKFPYVSPASVSLHQKCRDVPKTVG